MTNRTRARLVGIPLVAGSALLALAAPASAHVTITPSTTGAGAFTVLTVALSHGCDGSPTTKLAISIPEEILSVAPTRHPLWDVRVESEKLADPVSDSHGNEVTERDATVVFTARTPLKDGTRDALEISLQLPDAEGETLSFPTIQTCEQGETAWTEVAAEGQDPDELASPAPAVTITAAEGDGHEAEAAAGAGSEADDDSDDASQAQDTDDDGNTLALLGLGSGLLGLAVGTVALLRSRRRG